MASGLLTPNQTKAIPTTMQAAVYRGVGDVRVETVPVPQIGVGRTPASRAHLRHLRHGSQEDRHRLAFRASHFRS